MNHSLRKSTIVVLVTLALSILSIVIMTQQFAQASILDDWAQGRHDGRAQAKSDYPSFNNDCSGHITYCISFKNSYGDMWNHLNEVNKN